MKTSSSFRPWLSVISIALGAFAFVTTEFMPIGLLPEIAGDLGVSPGVGGLMVTLPGLVAAAAAPALVVGAGRVDRRIILLVLTALLAVSNAVSALAPSFAVMLVGRAFLGAALGGFWTLALTSGGRLVDEGRAASATAIILMGVSFATVFGVPLGALAGAVSWRLAFAATGALATLALIAQAVFLPRLPSQKAIRLGDLSALLRRTDGRVGLLVVALAFAGHFTAYTYLGSLLIERAGLGVSAVSSILLGYGVAGFLGNATIAAFVTRHLRTALIVLLGALAATLALLPLATASPVGIVALILVWGVAFGGLPLCLSVWMMKLTADAPEAGSAMFISNIQVAIAVGSLVGGRAVDAIGIPAALWLGGALALAGVSVLARFGRAITPRVELVKISAHAQL